MFVLLFSTLCFILFSPSVRNHLAADTDIKGTSQMIINKITPSLYYNYWLKSLETLSLNQSRLNKITQKCVRLVAIIFLACLMTT